MGYPILPSWGQRFVPSTRIFGKIKEGRIWKLVISICDLVVVGCYCTSSIQFGHYRHWSHHSLRWGRRYKNYWNCWSHDRNWKVLLALAHKNEISISVIFGEAIYQTGYPEARNIARVCEVCDSCSTDYSEQSHEHFLHLWTLWVIVSDF